MGFKCGIVGLPNVGKSTLFNALTKAGIEALNYPFCTIEPNVGKVNVPDHRLQILAQIVKPEKTIAASMQFIDIAGLVKGASKGEGLGNQFLANIRETDAIAHVVRCFENNDIIHVAGKVDPLEDIAIINTELALADLDTVEKALIKNQKNLKSGNKEAALEQSVLEKTRNALNQGIQIRLLPLSNDEAKIIQRLCLLTSKPVLYIANVNDDYHENNLLLKQVADLAKNENANVVAVSAATEAEIMNLDESERAEFLESLGLEEPGLNRVIKAGYDLLGLQTYFTAGEKEVRAWTITKGATAPQAAGVIHSDFERGFIRAEVIAFDDYVKYGSENAAKEAGKMRSEGKEYVVHDGDIIHFRFNV